MSKSCPVTGLFGGTFDPVHFGHLRPALEVCQDLDLHEVRWIPGGQPPHRETPLAETVHRLNMLRLAVQDIDRFTVDIRETERAGPSYTVDTLISLRKEMPGSSLALILGQDAFNGLPGWHRWQEILELAHVIVCARPGSILPQTGELAGRQTDDFTGLEEQTHGLVYTHPVTQLSISATAIRALIMQGKTPRYLLPAPVCDYIDKNGLYRPDHPGSTDSQGKT
ncbi:MAG TPA: nicotinate-nucleotide adenylyltransferase [Gammaproteobacteria bacterium]|nr:nicotinate-nucleotide adenylyltransferase [Gammaproteobacteria bacterium]